METTYRIVRADRQAFDCCQARGQTIARDRIAYYRERAARGLPLFDDGPAVAVVPYTPPPARTDESLAAEIRPHLDAGESRVRLMRRFKISCRRLVRIVRNILTGDAA